MSDVASTGAARRPPSLLRTPEGVTLLVAVLVASLVAVAIGCVYYATQREAIVSQATTELAAIRDLKVAQIESWKGDLLADGRVVASDPTLAGVVDRWASGSRAAAPARTLRDWMDSLIAHRAYVSAVLIGLDGRWVASTGVSAPTSDDLAEASRYRASRSTEATVTDLFLGFDGRPRFDVIAPVHDSSGRAVAVLVMRRDPARVLYPLIQGWPTPSSSSETLLIRQDADRVLYLNDLRFRVGAALRMSLPIATNQRLLAVQALEGRTRTVSGVDYRGRQVIGAVAPVPGTPWFIVAKMDTSEAFAGMTTDLLLTVAGVALVIAIILLGAALAWRQRSATLVLARADAERREVEASRAYERRLADLLDSISDAFIALDPAWRFTYVNDRAVDFLGKPRNALLGRTLWDAFPRVVGSPREESYRRAMRDRETVGFEAPDAASGRWLTARAYPASDGGITVFYTDITERKQAEEELRDRTEELARSNAELEKFAYVASHDLQEPLRMVASYTQLLKKRYQGQLDADADDFIGFAVDGANRMQQLINDLLAYSRVGTQGAPFVDTDLEQVLAVTLRTLGPAIGEAGGEVTHDELPTVPCDATQIGQVFQNLIANALKFHGDAPPRVHVSAARTTEGWEFCVADNGIGIEPEYFERIFVIFQRLQSRAVYPGTGMGLAICKRIVERHGGRIGVTSAPGRGSTFCFTLPGTQTHAQTHVQKET